ncbi:Bug family tripartite tricarboxylate transporter substrate binding protein [Dankookia rubra]|nr:tripartite tricarboxylate transporter substrate binding protein [Dankookia rubra]
MFARRHLLAGAATVMATRQARAVAFPQRPLRLVVSSSPGASLDTLARILSPALASRLGQPVVVENQGGANGLLAAHQVARAEPDGHTLLLTGDAIVLASLAQPQAGIGFETAFAPVTQAVRAAQILVTHPAAPFRNIAEYVATVRARPGTLNIGLPAQGGIAQVVHELLGRQLGGLRVEYVSYRGGGPAIADLLARSTDALVITLPAITEQVRQGGILPLAICTSARDPALPEVPSLAETVAPGFDVDSWQGVLAPAQTPAAVVARLHGALAGALGEAAVAERLTGLGFAITGLGPEAFRTRARQASEAFAPVVRSFGA